MKKEDKIEKGVITSVVRFPNIPKLNFLESIKRQANHKLSLSKKQMEFVTKIYNQCKKNIEKNENKS